MTFAPPSVREPYGAAVIETRAAMGDRSASQLARASIICASMRHSRAVAGLWSRFDTKIAAFAVMTRFHPPVRAGRRKGRA